MKKARLSVLAVFLISLFPAFLPAQEQDQPRLQHEVVVRYWLVPVYAMNGDGSPALGLKAEDLEVYVGGRKVDKFDLHRKAFQMTAAPRPEAPAETPPAPFQKKMVFLVFDSAFSTYTLLEKTKRIAEKMMAREDQAAQFVALSIEPFFGLRTICETTRDRKLIARRVKVFITGKKIEYLRTKALDSTAIRDVNPKDPRLAEMNPDSPQRPGRAVSAFQRFDIQEKRGVAAAYTQALMSLNLILGYFKDNTKVVYLFSCGIPGDVMEWTSESNPDPTAESEPGVTSYMNSIPDTINIEALKKIGRVFNQNGSLLFLINPSGSRIGTDDRNSGEQSLRLLADESGGRYYEGTEKNIVGEIAGMESAYYEISFPDDKAYEGLDIDFEIRARDPALTVYSVKRISRGKDYPRMGRLEKRVLVLNLLDNGPFAQTKLKVVDGRARASKQGEHVFFDLNLPPELSGDAWDIFKVWRDEETGRVAMEEDRLPTAEFEVRIAMAWRKGFRHELVLVHGRTGTALKAKL